MVIALTAERKAAMHAGRARRYARAAAIAADFLEARGYAGDVEAASALRQHGEVKLAAVALHVSRPALQARIASARRHAARDAARRRVVARGGLLADLARALQTAADGGDPGRTLLAEIASGLGIVPRVRE